MYDETEAVTLGAERVVNTARPPGRRYLTRLTRKARSIAEAGAVTGIKSLSEVTGPGWRPADRSDASTAATSVNGGPKSSPNWPWWRKWWKFGEVRSESEAMNELTAAGSGTFKATST
jgi:hypothetical protein